MIEYSSDSILKARTTIGNAHDFVSFEFFYSIEKYVCHLSQESLIFGLGMRI